MRTRRALRKAVLTAGLLGVAVTFGAAPAQAGAPIDRGTFHDVSSHTSAQDDEWPCTDLGFVVTIDLDIWGNFHYGPRRPGGPGYGLETDHGSVTYSAHDSTFKILFDSVNKDQTITVNDDGSLTIIVLGTGIDRSYVNGKLMFFDSGQSRFELHVTNPGQPNEQVDVVGLVFGSTGVNNGPTRTFCEDIADFLAA